ncbi:hypothetical protein LTR78_001549 [Recurvomyces mirabilis]|uniref:Glycosyltransferase family 31 protein n=1 Tax=Recurvomyces mirabilis TaxID=574656 RepID=A0AAE0WUW0_9PEZI|nr:hypothetical protein LTR78_001549 [Recurvomyces mirabilis]KAK5151879.1 hypothetical protein LTS14_009013 [Recurvomyces mirabilis]
MLSSKRSHIRAVLAFAFLALLLVWSIAGLGVTSKSRLLPLSSEASQAGQLPCHELPGASDTFVILRTGSTEIDDRFAIHLSTSIRCFPNYLIFSDFDEDYLGEHIIDALADVDPKYQESSPDFDLWRRLQNGGRSTLDTSELAGDPDRFSSMTGKADNPGWKLDKWKFLPMVNRTLHERPNMKWYVFIEADSFLLWSQLLQYLSVLDSTQPIYAGSQMFANGDIFAHGGSGFIVSQPALRQIVPYYSANKATIEQFTEGHWVGDAVLGKTFTDSGVRFKNAWPAFQGDYPGLVPYARADGRSVPDESLREWCYNTISYHHMSPSMIRELWSFEQEWMTKHNATSETIRHKDIFTNLVMPQMMSPRTDWDNLSDKEEGVLGSLEDCRRRCQEQSECRQYSLDADQMCRTRVDPRLGKAVKDLRSGWIEDRIVDFQRNMAPCGSEGWPL